MRSVVLLLLTAVALSSTRAVANDYAWVFNDCMQKMRQGMVDICWSRIDQSMPMADGSPQVTEALACEQRINMTESTAWCRKEAEQAVQEKFVEAKKFNRDSSGGLTPGGLPALPATGGPPPTSDPNSLPSVINVVPTARPATGAPPAPAPVTAAQPRTTPTTTTPSPGATTPQQQPPQQPQQQQPAMAVQDAQSAQAQANMDLSQCAQAQNQAVRCCGNPLSCASAQDRQTMSQINQLTSTGPPQGSLRGYCSQLEQLSRQSGTLNLNMGSICTSNQYTCQSSCQAMAQKYQSLLASCNGCDARSVYQNAASQLNSYASSCNQLRARADSMSAQGLSSSTSQAYARYCQDTANSGEQSAFNMPPPSNGGSGDSPSARTADSSFDRAKTQAQNEADMRSGDAGFSDPQADAQNGRSRFNLPSSQQFAQEEGSYKGIDPQSGTVNTVPNNTGGGIPGGGDQGSAQLGANGSARPSPGSPGYTTDVFVGMRSGGYSQPAGQNHNRDNQGSRGRARGKGPGRGQAEESGYLGMDLRRFLPGGSLDPNRRIAGYRLSSQINSKEANIWLKISNKMEERCRLGLLWQCR